MKATTKAKKDQIQESRAKNCKNLSRVSLNCSNSIKIQVLLITLTNTSILVSWTKSMSVKRGEGKVLETIETYTKVLEYPTEAFLGLTTESVPLNMWAGEVREKDGETFLKFTIGMEKEDTVIQPYIIFGVNRDLAQQKKCIA